MHHLIVELFSNKEIGPFLFADVNDGAKPHKSSQLNFSSYVFKHARKAEISPSCSLFKAAFVLPLLT